MQKTIKSLFINTVASILFITSSTGFVHGQPTIQPTGLLHVKKPVANQYIVVLRDTASDPKALLADRAAAIIASARDLSSQYSGEPGFMYETALRGFSVRMDEAHALALSKDPRVAYVEEDSPISANVIQSPAPWGLDRIDQHQGLNGSYNYFHTGAGVQRM